MDEDDVLEGHQSLLASWKEGLRNEDLDRTMNLVQGVAKPHPEKGVPSVFVECPEDAARVHSWSRSVTDAPVHVEVIGRLSTSQAEDNGGDMNSYAGLATGGKRILRQDGDEMYQATMAFLMEDAHGRPVGLSAAHALVPPLGALASSRELTVFDRDDEAFMETMAWRQLTFAHKQWPNTLDVAVGRLMDDWGGRVMPWHVEGLGGITGIADVAVDDLVSKNGAATHTTSSRIIHVGASIKVDTFWGLGRTFVLDDCIMALNQDEATGQSFSSPGDSGSAWLKRDGKTWTWAGILFAGSQSHSAACTARNIAEFLDAVAPGTMTSLPTGQSGEVEAA